MRLSSHAWSYTYHITRTHKAFAVLSAVIAASADGNVDEQLTLFREPVDNQVRCVSV
jgi:hypothetical protein